jgi:hypothetical protein
MYPQAKIKRKKKKKKEREKNSHINNQGEYNGHQNVINSINEFPNLKNTYIA